MAWLVFDYWPMSSKRSRSNLLISTNSLFPSSGAEAPPIPSDADAGTASVAVLTVAGTQRVPGHRTAVAQPAPLESWYRGPMRRLDRRDRQLERVAILKDPAHAV
jgi:hypothetical protein